MTITNHALAGALISSVVPNPVVAFVLAFLSHFAMDALPHYGRGRKESGESKLQNKGHMRIIKTDSVVALIIFAVIPFVLRRTVNPWVCPIAMIIAISPDLIWLLRYYRLKAKHLTKYPPAGVFSRFHIKIQQLESPPALSLEIVWFVLSLILIKVKAS